MRASIEMQTSKANSDGKCPLRLVVWHADRRALWALGVSVRPRHWNTKAQQVRKGTPNATEINAQLRRILELARTEADRLALTPGRVVTATVIRDAVRARVEGDEAQADTPCFLAYCDAQIDEYRRRGQMGTWESYRAQARKLRAFVATPSFTATSSPASAPAASVLPFDAVTPAVVRAFYAWLLTPRADGGQGNRLNTARKAITTLRTFWERAALEGKASLPNPFRAVSPKSERARKRKLSTAELRRLLTAPLPPDSLAARCRDHFAFAFYCGGARFSDVATMRRDGIVGGGAAGGGGAEGDAAENGTGGWRAAWRQNKTNDLHAVALAPAAIAILDRARPGWRTLAPSARLLPILDPYEAQGMDLSRADDLDRAIGRANAVHNKHLRTAARAAGLVDAAGEPIPVSFHLSRHSL
ncbi:MAG: site-specific integrase, partial [Bacteroidota bacterium]